MVEHQIESVVRLTLEVLGLIAAGDKPGSLGLSVAGLSSRLLVVRHYRCGLEQRRSIIFAVAVDNSVSRLLRP